MTPTATPGPWAPRSWGYDSSDRHVSTVAGTTSVTYVRDATDRIIARTEAGNTIHYGYAGGGDSSAFTTDSLNLGFIDRTVGLPGGAMVTKRGSGDVWSYPNVHGDVVATADSAGAKRGDTVAFDPYGKALTPTSATAPDGLADNSAGNFDYGWLGQHQRGLEHAPGIATIEMGARPYVPGMGRFLSVDPVEGGSANDYEYCFGDPINCDDIDGTRGHHRTWWCTTRGGYSCGVAFAAQRAAKSKAVAMRRYGTEAENAFLHAYWMAIVARRLGARDTRALGYAHEADRRYDELDRRKDLHNNNVGIAIGDRARSDADIEREVFGALQDGRLQCMVGEEPNRSRAPCSVG